MTQQQIDYLHDIGRMPDWAWYQQNGKSAQENYAYQKRKKNSSKKDFNKNIDTLIKNSIDEALKNLFKGFNAVIRV